MDGEIWWWAVYTSQREEITIEDSTMHKENCLSGEAARKKAEEVAENYLKTISQALAAKFVINSTFKITGRGLILAGYIEEGEISPGDTIDFLALSYIRQRKVIGMADIRAVNNNKLEAALLIKCFDEAELEELKNWKPNQVLALVYKQYPISRGHEA